MGEASRFTVAKLGGSLLKFSETPGRLRDWLSARSEDRLVLIVGGGALVDCLRVWSARHGLPELTAHWSSIECMDHNAAAVHEWLPEFERTNCVRTVEKAVTGRWIFDVRAWLRTDETLPRNWSVTSDSIAVALAGRLGAARVALLKSGLTAPEHEPLDCQQLAISGFVDPFFPHAIRQAGIGLAELVDLRRGRSRQMNFHGDEVGIEMGRQ